MAQPSNKQKTMALINSGINKVRNPTSYHIRVEVSKVKTDGKDGVVIKIYPEGTGAGPEPVTEEFTDITKFQEGIIRIVEEYHNKLGGKKAEQKPAATAEAPALKTEDNNEAK